MMTFRQLANKPQSLPTSTSWYLADLGESLGRQQLYTRQSPQRLNQLREHAIIESAISSNRLEGIEVDADREKAVVIGRAALRDRDEEEVRGYRDALQLIHTSRTKLPATEATIRRLHRLVRGKIWDAGKYKVKDNDIIERLPNGRVRVRFRTVTVDRTASAMKELVTAWSACLKERWTPPMIALAAFGFDYLCIHPFRDGNGRVSRLLTLLLWYHLDYEVGRYVSLERVIEDNKERYYETLEESSRHWHEGKHDPWPAVNFTLYVLRAACLEFERRVSQAPAIKGEKTSIVELAVERSMGQFRLADIQRVCPGVSVDMIRKVLKRMQELGEVTCLGRGPQAKWKRTGRKASRDQGRAT